MPTKPFPLGDGSSLKHELTACGAVLVGFGDLSEIPAHARQGFPIGISIAVKYPAEVIAGIKDLPTPEYNKYYEELNTQLDRLATEGADIIKESGYRAYPLTRENVGTGEKVDGGDFDRTTLPHKTIATRAGLGWIGKCALLVTKKYGSMIRISSILTDAPLPTAKPINRSFCGSCTICTDKCPAKAVSGSRWTLGATREELIDVVACRKAAEERSILGFGGGNTICGKCIKVCPFTRSCMMRETREKSSCL